MGQSVLMMGQSVLMMDQPALKDDPQLLFIRIWIATIFWRRSHAI